MGGQGSYVLLASTNTAYNIGTQIFQTDVTLQNRSAQTIGTYEGEYPMAPSPRAAVSGCSFRRARSRPAAAGQSPSSIPMRS